MKTNTVPAILLALSLMLANCSDGSSEAVETTESKSTNGKSLPEYSVYKDEFSDEPWGARINQEFILKEETADEEQLRSLLTSLYDKAKSSSKSQYFEHPTSVYIYVYPSKDKADSGNGQWVGSITQNDEDGEEPLIKINEKQLKLYTVVEQDKFGFSEEERQKIYKDITKVELQTIDNESLKPKLMKDLANELNTTVATLDSIETEGFTKGWTVHGI